jgi:two-component system sensor histidine kinase MprB
VRDRGVGIEPDEREHVFDRFYRAPAARSQPGSGLGLSIVQQIAEMHGGTAELLPREGGGTIARLTLAASRSAS